MIDESMDKERREFLRYGFKKGLHYSIVSSPKDKFPISSFIKAVSENLSASGILFIADSLSVPDVSSLVILDLDYKTARVCKKIEDRALIKNNKLLGRVVRIEDNEDGTCGVGVVFITKSSRLEEDISSLVR